VCPLEVDWYASVPRVMRHSTAQTRDGDRRFPRVSTGLAGVAEASNSATDGEQEWYSRYCKDR
jgi:hypothetical protein